MNSSIAAIRKSPIRNLLSRLAVVSLGLSATVLPAPVLADEEQGDLHPVARHMFDAWAAGDGAAFAEPFAVDALFVAPNGIAIDGRSAIAAGHQRLFDTVYKGSKITARQEIHRRLGDSVALVRILGKNSANPDAPGNRITLVLAYDETTGHGWKIVHAQLTPVQAPFEEN